MALVDARATPGASDRLIFDAGPNPYPILRPELALSHALGGPWPLGVAQTRTRGWPHEGASMVIFEGGSAHAYVI